MQKKPEYYAFFDVDGTLLKGKPMLSFLNFYYRSRFKRFPKFGEIKFKQFITMSFILNKFGVPREVLNRLYYKCYKNQSAWWLKNIGKQWFTACVEQMPNSYHPNIVLELIKHQKNGAEIVFVSGSFPACLEPIANKFNVKTILATTMKIKGDYYTGEIQNIQTIGQGKVQAIKNFLKKENYDDLERCYAYGDHHSDFPMLSLVGHPRVVAGDTAVENHAKEMRWNIIQPM